MFTSGILFITTIFFLSDWSVLALCRNELVLSCGERLSRSEPSKRGSNCSTCGISIVWTTQRVHWLARKSGFTATTILPDRPFPICCRLLGRFSHPCQAPQKGWRVLSESSPSALNQFARSVRSQLWILLPQCKQWWSQTWCQGSSHQLNVEKVWKRRSSFSRVSASRWFSIPIEVVAHDSNFGCWRSNIPALQLCSRKNKKSDRTLLRNLKKPFPHSPVRHQVSLDEASIKNHHLLRHSSQPVHPPWGHFWRWWWPTAQSESSSSRSGRWNGGPCWRPKWPL